MDGWLNMLAALATGLSALGLYAGSRHCRWAMLRRLGRLGTWAGVALAVVALALWVRGLGAGAGTCAMLASWMFAMMALPYIAGMRITGNARSDG
jgi:hypothetical protein